MGLYEEREETDAGDDRSHNLDAGAVEQNDHHREDPQRGAIKNPQKSGSKGDRSVADEHIPIQIFFYMINNIVEKTKLRGRIVCRGIR